VVSCHASKDSSFYSFFLETLRRSAEATMHTLVRMVFSKLHNLDPEEEEAKLSSVTEDEALEVELRMTVTTSKEKVDSEASDTPEGQTEVDVEGNDVQSTVAPQTKRPECKCKFLYSILL
jgi:brefeldin A-resistance guanine nucleotide exchange factor 1